MLGYLGILLKDFADYAMDLSERLKAASACESGLRARTDRPLKWALRQRGSASWRNAVVSFTSARASR